jgi:hypothetical protein
MLAAWREPAGRRWQENESRYRGRQRVDLRLRATLLWELSDGVEMVLRVSTGKCDAVNYNRS